MIIAISFDGVVVLDENAYDDLETPLRLRSDARAGLLALRRAGHTLILVSTRSNRSLRIDWRLNPLWRDGVVPFSEHRWELSRELNQRRFDQMVSYVNATLSGVFACIDDGGQGKVVADAYLDTKALRFGESRSWEEIAHSYGERAAG